jgi:hypothetical protein
MGDFQIISRDGPRAYRKGTVRTTQMAERIPEHCLILKRVAFSSHVDFIT